MARAGHGPFSLIRHVGRKSGRTYETPVILVHIPEGLIAGLTYGDKVDCPPRRRRRMRVLHHASTASTTSSRTALSAAGVAYPAPFRLVLKAASRK